MLKLRLQRIGRKKEPHFRLIAQDSKKDPWDKSVEILGWLNPRSKEKELKKDRIEYWLSVGAQVTDSVYNLLVNDGLIKGEKKKTFKISKKRKAKIEEKNKKDEPVEEKPEEKVNPPAKAVEAGKEKTEAPAEEKKEEVKVEETKPEEKVEEKKEEAPTKEEKKDEK